MSNAIVASGYAFPGYRLTWDLLLESEVDDAGDVLNPDLILPTNILCEKCDLLMKELEARYTEFQKQRETGKNADVPSIDDEVCRVIMPHYISMEEKWQAVFKGCYICATLLDAGTAVTAECIHVKGGGFLIPTNYISLTASGNFSRQSHPDQLEIWNQVERNELFRYKKCLLSIEKCRSNDDLGKIFSVELSASNASETTFQLVTSWLQPYRDEQRRFLLQESIAPKRLVDVGLTDQSQIRIIYPRDQSLYLTVSHRWGEQTAHGITLNDDTYKILTQGYEYSKLPRLFRDCVHVTRRLGLRYVWIDSLCIRQDNDEEKIEEINKMGDIYAGSFCNILAVSAEDGRSSLFTKCLRLDKRCHSTLWEMRHPKPHTYVIDGRSDIGIRRAPLYERAWVLQERLLAPRAIAYTHEGVFWYGNDNNITESYARSRLTTTWHSLLELRSTGLTEKTKADGEAMWMKIVMQYSRSSITDERDRKRALLGVISVLQRRTGLSIVCGVCEDFLPYSLLWTTQERRPNVKYTGPSWSSTFRHFGFLRSTDIRSPKPEGLKCRDWSIDEGTSMLSVTGWSNSSFSMRCKFSPRVFTSVSLRANDDHLPERLYADNGDWCDAEIQLDYIDSGIAKVDLVLLVESTAIKHAVGLILSKDHVKIDSWIRLGIFECRGYSSLSTFFPVEKTYQIS